MKLKENMLDMTFYAPVMQSIANAPLLQTPLTHHRTLTDTVPQLLNPSILSSFLRYSHRGSFRPTHSSSPVSTSSGILPSGSLSRFATSSILCARYWQNLLLALSFVPCLMNTNSIAHIIKLRKSSKLHAHGTPSF